MPDVTLPSADPPGARRREQPQTGARKPAQRIEGVLGGAAVTVQFDEKGNPTRTMVTKGEGDTLAPTTTEQEDAVVASQQRTSMMWETTQSVLSVLITGAVIYSELTGIPSPTLANAFFFVVALYLIRTNHTRIGGVGEKANEPTGKLKPYRGR